MPESSLTQTNIYRIDGDNVEHTTDWLAVEEPLEISILHPSINDGLPKNISITMRTPGNDLELAVGFLFTEGIIASSADLILEQSFANENTVLVALSSNSEIDIQRLKRNFYTTSSCGVCGKESIHAVKTACRLPASDLIFSVTHEVIISLPQKLQDAQKVFAGTGGIHASGLFSKEGDLLVLKEDVGRHNALDKLIGNAIIEQKIPLPLSQHILLLSGRASFELVQKAAMAGIKMICAVGAPSSLAVHMAQDFGITLIGFLRGPRFNIYSGKQRIQLFENC